MRINSLLFLTGNEGKAQELNELLALPDLKISHQKLNLTENQSAKIQEVSLFKTRLALAHPDLEQGWDAVLTDDVGLSLDALNGLPGPLIKFFLDSLGPKGVYDLTGNKGTGATAECMLGLGLPRSGEILHFQGLVKGELVEPMGEDGFGWDPIFKPQGQSQTYAQMGLAEKNRISHRALAIAKLKEWILSSP